MSQAFAQCGAEVAATDAAAQFHDAGCLLLRGALSPACVASIGTFLRDEVARHKERFRAHFGFEWGDADRLQAAIGLESASSSAYEALPADLKHLVRGELPLEVRLAPELKAVAHEPRVGEVVRAILGDPIVRMHNPPSVRVSIPGARAGLVPLHQDHSYNLHMDEFVTVWVPFCRIDDACGGIEILPRSHHARPVEHRPDGVWLRTEAPAAREELVPVYCEPGDAILFGPWLLHGSRPNRSDRIRLSIDYRFFPARAQSSKHYYDIEARTVRPPAPGATSHTDAPA